MNMQRRLEPFLPPLVVGLLIVIVLIGLIGTAIKNPQPHDIPVGLVGPAPAVQQISSSFATASPGAFDFTTFASEDDARAAVDARTVDGVLILGSASPHLIIAGAAGDGVTGVIATLISTLASQAVLFATGRNLRVVARLSLIVVYGALVGMTAMGMAAWIAGGYGDGFWAAAGLDALASIAIGAVVAGLVRLLGAPGIGLAALLMVLSLVSSGGPVGSQLLPDFYRALAPWATAGQLYSALRGALFFDGAALATPIAVLSGWLVVGLLLMGIGELATRSRKAAVAG